MHGFELLKCMDRCVYKKGFFFLICIGKPKKLCDPLYCGTHFIAMVWNQTISTRYVCNNFSMVLWTIGNGRKSVNSSLG